MLLPGASDLEEEPTIDWNKVLDNMQGTSLNVKFKLEVCPSGLSYSVRSGLLPSSVYAQSNVFCHVCIIAVQYNCYMLVIVCIIVHFYYIFYVYN